MNELFLFAIWKKVAHWFENLEGITETLTFDEISKPRLTVTGFLSFISELKDSRHYAVLALLLQVPSFPDDAP